MLPGNFSGEGNGMKLYFYIWLDAYQLRLSLKFPLLGGDAAPTALRERPSHPCLPCLCSAGTGGLGIPSSHFGR